MTTAILIFWLGLLSILVIGGIIHMMDQSRPSCGTQDDSTNNPLP